MKFTVKPGVDTRKPVAFIDRDGGTLYMQFDDPRQPQMKNAVLGGRFGTDRRVRVNGTGKIEELAKRPGVTPIYEGDTVEITF